MIKSIFLWTKLVAILLGLMLAGSSTNAEPASTVVVYPAPAGVVLIDTFSVAVRNVDFENIRAEHIREAAGKLIRLTFGFFEPSTTLERPIENIHFKNITYDLLAGSFISGSPGHPIKGVTFENLVINGERIKDAKQRKIKIGENVSDVSSK
jgi:hypothetical protein